MKYEFATPELPKLRIRLSSGRIEIETVDGAETVVELEAIRGDLEGVRVEQRGREIVIEERKRLGFPRDADLEVRIRAPHGADAELTVASADAHLGGRLGRVEINTASGDVEVGQAEQDARVRSASGDVRLRSVGGKVDVNTASGNIELGQVGGGISVHSASGDVRIEEAGTGARIHTASGDQTIESVAQGKVDLKSASGDLSVGIRRGSRLSVDARSMSGETSSEVELLGAETSTDGSLVELKAVTMSGDIRVVRAG